MLQLIEMMRFMYMILLIHAVLDDKLCEACKTGSISDVVECLRQGLDVNHKFGTVCSCDT